MIFFLVFSGYSGFESMTSMTSLTSTPTSLHSKGSLTASYSEHCPQSLPPFTGRYGTQSDHSKTKELFKTASATSKGERVKKNS